MCAKFGCGPTVVSKKGGVQTDKGILQLYIVEEFLTRAMHEHPIQIYKCLSSVRGVKYYSRHGQAMYIGYPQVLISHQHLSRTQLVYCVEVIL